MGAGRMCVCGGGGGEGKGGGSWQNKLTSKEKSDGLIINQ